LHGADFERGHSTALYGTGMEDSDP
jgi:hypothetical protein